MSERTKLLKKAVMTGVGGATNVDRIKSAITEAMNDLVKVGQDLLDDLEDKGNAKTDTAQNFIKNLKIETEKKGFEVEKNVKGSMKKAAKELGLITREDYNELYERIASLEEAVGVTNDSAEETEEKKSRKKKGNNN